MGESKRAIFTIHNISISSNLYAFVYLGQDAYYTEQRVQQGHSWSRSYDIWIFNYLVQSVAIITKVVSSNPVHDEVYLIQHYVIKFVSDLRQVGLFHCTPVFSTNKTDCHEITEILLKVLLNTINQPTRGIT